MEDRVALIGLDRNFYIGHGATWRDTLFIIYS